MTAEKLDLAIVGAGPIGIEAALYAQRLGLSVRLLEQTPSNGWPKRAWAQANMFSPWTYNYSPLGIELLRDHGGFDPPSDFGRWGDYLDGYLTRIARTATLDIRYGARVIGIGRAGIARNDLIGKNRTAFPFRLLIAGADGEEEVLLADRVIDASGVGDAPLWMGEGRLPAINERALRSRILPGDCDLEARVDGAIGKTWLVIGDGYEAAMAVTQIRGFLEADAKARLVFIDERGRQPRIKSLKNDLFLQRVELLRQANEFLDSGHPRVDVHAETRIHRIDAFGAGFRVELRGARGCYGVYLDHLVNATGYGADDALWRELQIHQCYGTGAPMNTAGAMYDDILDGRHTPHAMGCDSLRNPEPGFYVLGSKSYGRTPGFSLHIGLGQIVGAFRGITGDATLDLYAAVKDSPIPSGVVYLQACDTPRPVEEMQLSDSEQTYKTIADNLQEVVFQTDLRQFITYLSPSWEKLSGKDPASFIGLHWQDLLASDMREQGLSACNAFMSNRTSDYREELVVEHADGSRRWVEVRAKLLVDLNGVAYGTIGTMVDITARVEAQAELERKNRLLDELAITDPLTGIHNRRHFDRMLEREIRHALRDGMPLTLAMIDIDHFKPYNDTYGHQLGDDALTRVADVLRSFCQRKTDLVARYGGEEFVVLLPGTGSTEAAALLESMRERVMQLKIQHRASPVHAYITVTIGAATLGGDPSCPSASPESLLKHADRALYEGKRQGRNCTCFHGPGAGMRRVMVGSSGPEDGGLMQ
ncbi:MAG: diguanylate cyclase domain-containing protein [Thiobacillus sp.]